MLRIVAPGEQGQFAALKIFRLRGLTQKGKDGFELSIPAQCKDGLNGSSAHNRIRVLQGGQRDRLCSLAIRLDQGGKNAGCMKISLQAALPCKGTL